MDLIIHTKRRCQQPVFTKQTLKVMRLTAILLLAACMQVSAKDGSGQITLSEQNAPFSRVMEKIQAQSGYDFVSTYETLKEAGTVTVKVKNVSLQKALEECLEGKPLNYVIIGKTVVIKTQRKILDSDKEIEMNVSQLLPPPVEIKGRVTDENGKPLVGVSVTLKGSPTVGTTTNENGEYLITIENSKGVLEFTSVGFITQVITVNGNQIINVTLKAEISELEQVVVTGYTTQKKKDITGSVDIVDMKAMKSIPSGSAANALQGQAAGVNVINSGTPGSNSNVFIRGITSFGDTQPLVLIDGVPGNLTDIDINNIASIQVLKDAGAAAIYGVRGSNGVIIITTLRGKSGTPKITYNGYYGYQVPPSGNVFDIASPEDQAKFWFEKINPNTGLFPNGIVPDFTYAGPGVNGIGNIGDPAVDPSNYVFDKANPGNDYLIQKLNKSGSGTDWFHQVFKTAPKQSHNLTMQGGTDKSNYLFSLGYFDQQGVLIHSYMKRYSARINTDFKIGDFLTVGENAYFFYKQTPPLGNTTYGEAIYFAHMEPQFIPVHDINGNYGGTWLGPTELGVRWNPVAIMENSINNRTNTWNTIGNIYAEFKFLKHFNFRSSFGGSIDNEYSYTFAPNKYQDKEQHALVNKYSESALYNSNWIWTNTVTYNQTFNLHSVKLLAGTEAIRNFGRTVGGTTSNYLFTDPNYLNLSNGTSNVTNSSSASSNTLYSVFSRLDYAFSDRYLISGTLRRDGSSRFGSERRYGVFPSFSVGWRASRENFMKNLNWINNLMLRGSWGKMGSQNNVSPTNAFSLYSQGFASSYYAITGSNSISQGFYQSRIGNPNTGWEEDIITNIGIDATILSGKLEASVEWYNKKIKGLLFTEPLPSTVGGATAPTINIGNIQNKGWDVSVTYHAKVNNNLSFDLTPILTTYKNSVINIPNPGYFDVSLNVQEPANVVRNQVGHPVGAFFGYEVIGFFQDESDVDRSPVQTDAAPGRFKYKDVNGDGVITPDDRTFFGDPNPDFTYGFNIGAKYKGFDFSTILYGSQGNDVYNVIRMAMISWAGKPQALPNDLVLRSWTPNNPNPKAPVAESASSFSDGRNTSFFMENGSYLKCRSIIIGYTINKLLSDRIGISNLRVYLQGTNLFDITKYRGLDPELSGSSQAFGLDFVNYPNNFKEFILGVNLTF